MMFRSRIRWSACSILLAWMPVAHGQPAFDFVLETVECPAGQVDTFCSMARLVTRNTRQVREGAEAWSLGISADGCAITDAITTGTESHVDPEQTLPESPNAFVHLEYTANQVVLAVVRDFRSRQTLAPQDSPHDLLLLQLEGLLEGSCDSCVLRYVDGLRGSGRNVDNAVTADLKSVRPSLGSSRIPWRSPPCTAPPADLAAASPSFTETLRPCKPSACFAFTAPAGKPLLLKLTDTDAENSNAMFLHWGDPGSPDSFDQVADRAGRANQELLVAAARGQTAFLFVDSFDRHESSDIEVIAVLLDMTLQSVSPARGTRDTRVKLVMLGAGFQERITRFRLRSTTDENLTRGSQGPSVLASDRVEVDFDLSGLPVGTYHVEAFVPEDGGGPDLLQARVDAAFEIRERIEDVIEVTLSGGRRNGRDRLSRMTLAYENVGNDAVTAPILRIRSPEGTRLRLDREQAFQRNELLLMGIDPFGFAGRLSPGTRHEIAVLFRTSADFECDVASFEVSVLSPTSGAIPWTTMDAPPGVEDWESVGRQLERHLGATWEEYNAALADLATRLSRRGSPAESVLGLCRFAVRQALDRPVAGAVGKVLANGTLAPLGGVTVAAFEGEVKSASTVTDAAGDFSLDCLENNVNYRLEVDGYGPGVSFAMPAEGDLFGLQLALDEQVNEVTRGGVHCDETSLPTAPIFPPPSLFVTETDWETLVVCAIDPNTKDGPQGDRPEGFLRTVDGVPGAGFVSSTRHVYRINFENTGNAPAQRVEIRDRLTPEIKLDSIELGEVVWGDYHVRLKPTQSLLSGYNLPVSEDPLRGRGETSIQHWQDPERQLLTRITARVFSDRVMEWRFETLDPERLDSSGEPQRATFFDDGFLPPDDGRGGNEGYVTFSAEIEEGLKEDQPVTNDATIVFDGAEFEALVTPPWTNFFSEFAPAELPSTPSPADEASDVSVNVVLTWSTDPEPTTHAYSYTVTLWKGEATGRPLRVLRGLRERSFRPGGSSLAHGETFSWQVTAKNRRDDPMPGPIWTFTTGSAVEFVRGDSNNDGAEDISDGVFTLVSLFEGGPILPCLDSADANDDGTLDLSDPIYELAFLFLGGPPPAPPRSDCGSDPTPDSVTCGAFDCP